MNPKYDDDRMNWYWSRTAGHDILHRGAELTGHEAEEGEDDKAGEHRRATVPECHNQGVPANTIIKF